jgi:hypothetical protein
MKGALHNFLGTLASRYTAFNGYWLFGFLPSNETLRIDLLKATEIETRARPESVLTQIAVMRFAEQCAMARVDRSIIRKATLAVTFLPTPRTQRYSERLGRDVSLEAWVVLAQGARFQDRWKIFVAPHDPLLEAQSRSPR